MLEFDEFGMLLGEALIRMGICTEHDLALRHMDRSTGLPDSLGVDSLGVLQLLIWVEELADPEIVPFEFPAVLTAGDLFSYYQSLCVEDPPWRPG